MAHRATRKFWQLYARLPEAVRELADKNFEMLKTNERHPSLKFKRVGELWSVRIGIGYRALALSDEYGFTWIWIGSHAEYDRLIGQR